MNCNDIQKHISNYLDGDLPDRRRQRFEAHVGKCELCAAEISVYKRIMQEAAGLEKKTAPDHLWQAIEQELENEPRAKLAWLRNWLAGVVDKLDVPALPAPAVKIAGAVAVLLLGIIIGRYFIPPQNGDHFAIQSEARQQAAKLVSYRTENYIEKSKVLFLGVINADEKDLRRSDWRSERNMAQGLVQEAVYLKENLSTRNNARLKRLVEELELILLEIANMEVREDLENVDMIKSGIDRKGLLLKIHLHELAEDAAAGEM